MVLSVVVWAGGPEQLRAASESVQARERVLYVSAFDTSTFQPVATISPDHVVVREDGARREILRVAPATSPMPTAIIVDNSQAVAPAIADLRRALTSFVGALGEVGPVALVTIADRPTIVADYTTSLKSVSDAAARLFHGPNSGATLLDAITDVAKGLAKREADRAAVVVVTSENTEFSHFRHQDTLAALKTSGASLHAVVLLNPQGSLDSDEERSRATVLDRGPRESGGVRLDVLTSMSFESRLKDLAAILTSQQRVVYARPDSLIPPEKVEVSSGKAGIDVRGTPARGQGAR
jgi:hypothetical protein